MPNRSGKFYRKNEAEVMLSIGLKPTKNSGSGWIEKEDGQNDYLICQLKSTDAKSIRVEQKDIRILEENAAVANKTPIFAINFLNTGEVWLMAKPEDFTHVAEYINTGKTEKRESLFGVDALDAETARAEAQAATKVITSVEAREEYMRELEEACGSRSMAFTSRRRWANNKRAQYKKEEK